MGDQYPAQADFFNAFIRTAQYITRLTQKQDILTETGNALVRFYGAGVVGFFEYFRGGDLTGHHWVLPEGFSQDRFMDGEMRGMVAEVMDTGFLATHKIEPEGFSAALLPIIWENKVTAVMFVAHRTSDPVPDEILNSYLAVAGLVSTAVASAVVAFNNVAEKKKAEDALKEAQENLAFLVKNTPAMLYRFRSSGDLAMTFISENVRTQLGFEPEAFTGDPGFFLSRVHPDDRTQVRQIIEKALAAGVTVSEYRFLGSDGVWRWIHDEMRLVPDNNGGPAQLLGYWFDFSRRKVAEEELLRKNEDLATFNEELTAMSEELQANNDELLINERALRESLERNTFLSDILDRSSQPFGVGYPDGRLGIVNQAFEELTGYTADELQRMDWAATLTPQEWQDADKKSLDELHRTGKPVRYEKEYIKKDGTRIAIELLVHFVADKDGNPQYYYSFITDITEQKRNREILSLSNQVLHSAEDHDTLQPLLEEYVRILQEYTGCDSIGVRILDEQGNIPYLAYAGFSRDFYEQESPLSVRTDHCMCITVIEGTTDPSLPFYTAGGSFMINATTKFLTTVSREEKGKTRNICNMVGYESVALIPIRKGDQIMGLLHLADHQEGKVPVEKVEVLEQVAYALGASIVRVQTEEALRRQERTAQAVLAAAKESIWLFGTDDTILMANPTALARLGGKDARDVIGHQYPEFMTSELAQGRRAQIKEVIRSHRPVQFEDTRAGAILTHTFYPVFDEAGAVSSIAAFSRDITGIRQAEEALLKKNEDLHILNEELTVTQEELHQSIDELTTMEHELRETGQYLENLIQYANAPIIVWDPAFRITRFNHAFELLIGRKAADVIGQPLELLFPQKFVEPVLDIIRKTTGGERMEVVEIPILHRNGEVRTVLWNSAAIFGPDGETVLSTIAQGQDITERKQVEEQLRYHANLVETVSDAIISTDTALVIRSWNPAAEKMYGWRADEVVGKQGSEILRTDFPKGFSREGLTRDLFEQGSWRGELIQWTKDGRAIIVEATSLALKDKSGAVVGGVSLSRDITERRRTEEALHEAHLRLTHHIENSPLAVVEFDAQFRVTRWSDEAEKVFGWTMAEVMGRTIDEIPWIYEEDVERVAAISADMMNGKAPRNKHTNRNYRKDGAVIICEWYNSALRDETGELVSILSQVLDVTERDRAAADLFGKNQELSELNEELTATQEELRQSVDELTTMEHELRETGQYLENLIQHANAPIIVWDPAFRITRFNHAFELLVGRKAVDVIGQPLEILFPEKFVEPVLDIIRKTNDGERMEVVEIPIVHQNGEVRTVLWNSAAIFEADGKTVQSTIAQGHDITKRKWAEEALRQSEERYRMLFNTLTEGFCIIEMLFDADERPIDYRFLEINPAFEKQTGLHEAQGRLISDLAPDNEAYWYEIYGTIAVTGEPARFENEAKALNRWYEVSAYRVGGPESRRVAILFNDITERKQAEEVLKTFADNLKTSNQELEQFAYIASHDLKEPLRMVTSFSQILERQYKGRLDANADEFIGYIVDGAQRMEALINDLLRYSRINQGMRPIEPIDMKDAIEDATTNLLIPIREREARITLGAMPSIQGDLSQMVQLFQNLIGNAVKYCPEDREPEIWINAERTGKDWTFSVKDNGIGIDPEYHGQIFMIFRRLHTRTEYPGTGIGLAVVKRIVERHGGRIWVESEEGNGSTFFFTIPENSL